MSNLPTIRCSRVRPRRPPSQRAGHRSPTLTEGRAPALLLCLAGALLISALPACTSARWHKPGWLMTRADVARYLTQAVDDPNPDVRRQAITHLTRTRRTSLPLVGETFAMVARTDSSERVRRAAIQALAHTPDAPAALATLKSILEGPQAPEPRPSGSGFKRDQLPDGRGSAGANVLSAGPEVRAVALETAHALLLRAGTASAVSDEFCHLAIARLAADPSRDVKIMSARLLELCHSSAALDGLIAGLRNRDFGVAYTCARSLRRLTSQTFELDADRWRAWAASVDDPFADRQEPGSRMTSAPDHPWWRLDRFFRRNRDDGDSPQSREDQVHGATDLDG